MGRTCAGWNGARCLHYFQSRRKYHTQAFNIVVCPSLYRKCQFLIPPSHTWPDVILFYFEKSFMRMTRKIQVIIITTTKQHLGQLSRIDPEAIPGAPQPWKAHNTEPKRPRRLARSYRGRRCPYINSVFAGFEPISASNLVSLNDTRLLIKLFQTLSSSKGMARSLFRFGVGLKNTKKNTAPKARPR